mmetsp:Transcript_2079/g.2978  ORF Transcript_2079/g.2978 Transcript_2079/m.2978 type:complete len:360 (-) Transcript_2079:110-1189(-)
MAASCFPSFFSPQRTRIIYLLSRSLVVLHKPIHSLLNSIINGRKVVIRLERSQLFVRRRLFELSIRLGGVKDDFLFGELHRLGNGQGHVLDGDFGLLVDAQCDRRRVVILAHDPNGEFGEISRVNELSEGGSGAPDGKFLVLLFGNVAFVDQAGNDVSVLYRKVVRRAVNVGGDDGGEIAVVLLRVGSIHGIDQTLGVGVSLVGGMGRAVVKHGFVDRVGRLVGKDASAQHAHQLFDLVNATTFHDIVVDQNVFTEEFHLLRHVGKQPADFGGQVNHVGRLFALENGLGVLADSQIAVLARQKDPSFVLRFGIFDVTLDRGTDQAAAASHHDYGLFGGFSFCHIENVYVLLLLWCICYI